ncbi:iron uptake porin [Sphaerospermopsis kisseleviana CS-549]|uniref:Iron uptake porin n=1 Tax=Sphaerospermopsis kisseleviana CS-549 TaxID=3021783 RepID=A0ABT4ZXS8_9CYAN|nr:iron uptake porin [Sphaerospermopsis kisseleviana]MDB9444245.1 iron uptake porin [Sphaerospermopsis kisseleviana CS-549]BAZ79418.1 S-layer region-like protein [Sphaerospermopsis kisseleviana NIES-73]
MAKKWNHLTSPAICSIILCANTSVFANEPAGKTETNYSQQELISQVTSVSQLSDVQPGDWAFQSLQSLVERYGCIAGYPNGTYRGNRALTRYEFAAGLNACLDRVNELIATATADGVTKQDLATIQKLQEEFSAELATLRGRVDALEAKTSELEANQFSTTTKLQGQVVAVVSDVLSGDQVNGTPIADKNTTLGARTRIEFVSSFTGKDTLFTRIESNNINTPDLLTGEGNLAFAGSGTTTSVLGTLSYRFPLSEKTQAIAIASGGAIDDITSTVNIFDGDGAFGALSTFGTRNPIYGQIGGSGLGVTHQFSNRVGVSLGYLAGSANNPASGSGLFDGPYGALAQLTVKPSDRITLGLTYINSYNTPLATGSNNATSNYFTGNSFSSNSYGVQASIGISDKFVLGGWGGYTNSNVLTGARGDVDIWNYAVTLGFRDLGKKGNLAGIIVGMEPKVTSTSTNLAAFKDQNTSYHIEAFYQYKLNDNITITPGVIWLTAPDHNTNNNDVVIGALRTTFSF